MTAKIFKFIDSDGVYKHQRTVEVPQELVNAIKKDYEGVKQLEEFYSYSFYRDETFLFSIYSTNPNLCD
jgi:hypothetical protein